jgi:hypothetical membrane protein
VRSFLQHRPRRSLPLTTGQMTAPAELTGSGIRWWSVVSASLAPVVLAGGWTVAAGRQPAGYDSVRDTISSLAARGATDRWIMTSALAGVGACYVLSGLGIRPAKRAGRIVLVGGGVATVLVAAFPQPESGNSVAHTVAAAIAFIALAAWPALGAHKRSGAPLLEPRISIAATLTMFGLLAWFVLEAHGSHRGLAERSAALAEALWPFLIVATALGSSTSSGSAALDGRQESADYTFDVRNLKTAPDGSATVAKRP